MTYIYVLSYSVLILVPFCHPPPFGNVPYFQQGFLSLCFSAKMSQRARERCWAFTPFKLHAMLVHLSSPQTDTLTDETAAAALTIQGLQLFREGHSLKGSPILLCGIVLDLTGLVFLSVSMWQRVRDRSGKSKGINILTYRLCQIYLGCKILE